MATQTTNTIIRTNNNLDYTYVSSPGYLVINQYIIDTHAEQNELVIETDFQVYNAPRRSHETGEIPQKREGIIYAGDPVPTEVVQAAEVNAFKTGKESQISAIEVTYEGSVFSGSRKAQVVIATSMAILQSKPAGNTLFHYSTTGHVFLTGSQFDDLIDLISTEQEAILTA